MSDLITAIGDNFEVNRYASFSSERIVYNFQEGISDFIDQRGTVETLQQLLDENRNINDVRIIPHTIVISGIAGIGKTELVRQYIKQYRNNYHHILWVNAKTKSQLMYCFYNIARQTNCIELITNDGKCKSDEDVITEVFQYICMKPSVIVFDNAYFLCERAYEQSAFIPKSTTSNCVPPAIIITSQMQWQICKSINMNKLDQAVLYNLLEDQLNFKDNADNRLSVENIYTLCDGIPLLIQHIIAIIRSTHASGSATHQSYQMKDFLRDYNYGVSTDLVDGINTASDKLFTTTFYYLSKNPFGEEAHKCLDIMSLLNPDCIPEPLLHYLINSVTSTINGSLPALSVLKNLSLVHHSKQKYKINRVIQIVKIEALKRLTFEEPNCLAKTVVSTAKKFCEYLSLDLPRPHQNEIFTNGIHFMEFINVENFNEVTKQFLINLKNIFRKCGRYRDAWLVGNKLLDLQVNNHDLDSAENTKKHLGIILSQAGAHQDAITLFDQILQPDWSHSDEGCLGEDSTQLTPADEKINVRPPVVKIYKRFKLLLYLLNFYFVPFFLRRQQTGKGTNMNNKHISNSSVSNIRGSCNTININTVPKTQVHPIMYPVIPGCIESFAGRECFLKTLHNAIQYKQLHGPRTAVGQTNIISGIGGVGKTETVRKYLQDYKHCYTNVIWINAKNYTQIRATFVKIAKRNRIDLINETEFNFEEDSILAQDVYNTICQTTSVIVYDNAHYENESGVTNIGNFMPGSIPTHWTLPAIIVTTQNAIWGDIEPLKLKGLQPEESYKLLSSQLGVLDKKLVAKIRHLCDGLPLLLQQVIAVIKDENIKRETIAKDTYTLQQYYLEHVAGKFCIDQLPGDQRISVYNTFKMTFQKLAAKECGEYLDKCLDVLAFLNPDGIPVKLLIFLVGAKDEVLTTPLLLLRNYNLISLSKDTQEYGVHRMVQITRLEMLAIQSKQSNYPNSRCLKQIISDTASRFNKCLENLDKKVYEFNTSRHAVLQSAWYLLKVINQQDLSRNPLVSQFLDNLAAQHGKTPK